MMKMQRAQMQGQTSTGRDQNGGYQQYRHMQNVPVDSALKGVHEGYSHHYQERSFSLHTAPMPSSHSDVPHEAPLHEDLYGTPGGERAPYQGPLAYDMLQECDGAYTAGRHQLGYEILDQTAFDGDQTYERPIAFARNIQPTLLRREHAPAWASVPAPQMPFSPGELCDYAPLPMKAMEQQKAASPTPDALPSPKPQVLKGRLRILIVESSL